MKLVDVNSSTYIDFNAKITIKILNLKLVNIKKHKKCKKL